MIKCSICNKNFDTKESLINHNHCIEYNIIDKSKMESIADKSILSGNKRVNRIIKFRDYLNSVFNNITISVPLNLKYSDIQILKPLNKKWIREDGFITICSNDKLILKSIQNCFMNIIIPCDDNYSSIIYILENYIPDLSINNPFKFIIEHYSSLFINDIKNIDKNIVIPNIIFKISVSYNVYYIKLPIELMNHILGFIKIVDYDKAYVWRRKLFKSHI